MSHSNSLFLSQSQKDCDINQHVLFFHGSNRNSRTSNCAKCKRGKKWWESMWKWMWGYDGLCIWCNFLSLHHEVIASNLFKVATKNSSRFPLSFITDPGRGFQSKAFAWRHHRQLVSFWMECVISYSQNQYLLSSLGLIAGCPTLTIIKQPDSQWFPSSFGFPRVHARRLVLRGSSAGVCCTSVDSKTAHHPFLREKWSFA